MTFISGIFQIFYSYMVFWTKIDFHVGINTNSKCKRNNLQPHKHYQAYCFKHSVLVEKKIFCYLLTAGSNQGHVNIL